MQPHYDAVAALLRSRPAVQDVTTATGNIVNVPNATVDIRWEGKDPNISYFIHPMAIDKDFLRFFKLQVTSGAGFTGSPADSAHFILNETAVKEAGIKDPVGKRLTFYGTAGTIIGVVKDFHFASLKEKIQPFIFYYRPVSSRLFVRTTGRDAAAAIKAVQTLWPRYNAGFPLEYTFMDDTYSNLYKTDQQTGMLFDCFTVIAILISCLGLFGLATYSAHVKVKEIGIRKVLGASVMNITTMLSRDFLTLALIAIIIAMPLAWWATNQWLVNFAYRVTIGWSVFVTAGIAALLVTIATVSFQAVKAALANPVKNLRVE
jgi:putative ABC transport system permease protein